MLALLRQLDAVCLAADDLAQAADAPALKPYAGSASITRSSGKKRHVG